VGALDQAEANRLLNASLALATYTAATAPIMNRCMATNGSAASAGTQVTGGSYAPQSLTAALPAGGTNGAIATTGTVSHTGMPAGTVNGVEWWDSSPRREWWGALTTPKTLGAGDTLSFPPGSLTANNNT
jgi:hypothetical protein